MHNYAYEYHEHNPRREPIPQDSVSCNACRGTGLIQGGQAHFLGGRVLRCTRCGGHGLVRATSTSRPSPRGDVSILKPQANPVGLTPSERERLMQTVEQVVTDAERQAAEERKARQREQIEEQERQREERRATREREQDEEQEHQAEQEPREQYVSEQPDIHDKPDMWQPHRFGMHIRTENQSSLSADLGRPAERRGRVGRFFRRVILASGLISIGAIAALFLTQTPLEDVVDSVRDFWNDSGIEIPGGESEESDNSGSDSIAPPIAPSATATATATPTPLSTAAPTPTPIPVSPWAGFAITQETQGKDILDRLSDEERACVRSANSDAFYESFPSRPIGVRIAMTPPVRDTTDLPELADCLSEESTAHLNQAIAIFHDPSLAPPSPTPAPTFTPTPRPTETPAEVSRTDRLRKLALDLLNQDRADHGLPSVSLGSNQAAQLHAQDMLSNDYQGHWWADGRKPYMVYTQTRGTSYAAENVASSGWLNHEWTQAGCGGFLVRCIVPTPEEAIRDLQWRMMYDDAHAKWGHRDNILRETHRAVNIGIAWNSRRVVFVQHFAGGTVTADSPPSLDDNGVLRLSVTKNETGIRIGGAIGIYYDPPPAPVSRQLNDSLDSYCLGGGATTSCPDYVIRILDPPGPGRFYTDLDTSDVVASSWRESATSFSFSADVGRLMERPGVYTVSLWRDEGGSRFTDLLVELSVFVE